MSASGTLRLKLGMRRDGFTLDVDLELPSNGITVLFGPSGSGKTTLLRCIAGLEQANGWVSLNGEVWQDSASGVFVPTWQRAIGYVFQESSLFDHLTVEQNLLFGMRRTQPRPPRSELAPCLDRLGIAHLLHRSASGLSGGERQRVAIARALLTRPQVLLLDEPMASLDVARRREVLPWLEQLHKEAQCPIVHVTHSVDELTRLADHLVILQRGTAPFFGPVTEVMASAAVAKSLGDEAGLVTEGRVIDRDPTDAMVQVEWGAGVIWARDPGIELGQTVRMRLLARDVSLTKAATEGGSIQNRFEGLIEFIEEDTHPAQALVGVRCGTELILSQVTHRSLRQLGLGVNDAVWCLVKSVAVMI